MCQLQGWCREVEIANIRVIATLMYRGICPAKSAEDHLAAEKAHGVEGA